ncbi:plastidial pyruvate kinase 4, chloroplastic [Olea europaea subsp. europaea]|uniref:pyruvate kinase n=2 Tax=Olea europaea subsp. europaea TaxID=158383 RepID=A0A8S0TVN1_OLEEU|nr:plastidial pyruvate kinase 4, chloroplastic [Olea europaea subsp. europaea]
MMISAVSVCSITNQTMLLNYGIQATVSSDFTSPKFYQNFMHLPSKLNAKNSASRNHIFLFGSKSGNVTLRTVVCAVPNEQDDSERCVSHHFADDSVVIHPLDDENSQVPGFTPQLQSDTDIQQTFMSQGNQESLLDKLKAGQLHVLAMEQWNSSRLKMCHWNYLVSATNLIHYLALKSLDIEHIKEELSSLGLMNLETINPYVLSSLSACIQMLNNSKSDSLHGYTNSGEVLPICKSSQNRTKGDLAITAMMKRASSNRNLLLGTLQGQRGTHIMVTVGQEVVENDTHVAVLIEAGATIFRINCAHGNPDIWNEIIRRVKKSSQVLEKPCRVLMDLAGPKLRTGKLKAGPCVLKISPKKNAVGSVICPAKIWLSPQGAGPPPPHVSPDVILHVDGQEFLSKLEVDDSVRFCDARGKQRELRILSKYAIFSGVGFLAECRKTAYVESGTVLRMKEKRRKYSVGFVIDVPPAEKFVRLRVGDLLILSRDSSDELDESTSSSVDANRITCSSGYLFDSVRPGDPIAFDDGKIWGVIKGISISEVIVSITHAGPRGTKLGSEKSVNIPESQIRYEGLTSKDIMDLDFVAGNADMVGISFIRDIHEIVVLRQELAKRKNLNLGVILKIETRDGFENLPLLLLEAMKSPNPLGVMIARGDLAVECGWEKLADIQEEIISICNAAHVPVIWATQVLESLIKSGVPTRAEITDAANGRRISCVMLNKGKHIAEAVSTLVTILSSKYNKTKAELKPLLLSSHIN